MTPMPFLTTPLCDRQPELVPVVESLLTNTGAEDGGASVRQVLLDEMGTKTRSNGKELLSGASTIKGGQEGYCYESKRRAGLAS